MLPPHWECWRKTCCRAHVLQDMAAGMALEKPTWIFQGWMGIKYKSLLGRRSGCLKGPTLCPAYPMVCLLSAILFLFFICCRLNGCCSGPQASAWREKCVCWWRGNPPCCKVAEWAGSQRLLIGVKRICTVKRFGKGEQLSRLTLHIK